MRSHFHLAWRWEKRFFFKKKNSLVFFLLSGVSFFFFFCSAELPVDHCILSMHFSFFFFTKTRRVFACLPFVLGLLSFFFFFTSGCHSPPLFFFFWFLPLLFLRWEGKGEKTKVTTATPRSTQTKILEPQTTETDITQNFMRLQPNRTYLKQVSCFNLGLG